MKKTILTAMALAATTTIAFANAPQPHGHEPGGKRGQFIEQADANKDGSVSADEFKSFAASKSAERFKKLDANSDGMISQDEFSADSGKSDKVFERLDANKDGVINKDDRAAAREKFKQLHGEDVPPPPDDLGVPEKTPAVE